MAEQENLFEKILLNEIDGKNRAIHAYDGIAWKIRSGFLTILFGCWAIFIKAVVETSEQTAASFQHLAWAMFVFSLGFAIGAWYVDRSYLRRKFRVILALNRLMEEIQTCSGNYHKVSIDLIKVAGDSVEMPYRCKSYRNALNAELTVYLLPLLIVFSVVILVFYDK